MALLFVPMSPDADSITIPQVGVRSMPKSRSWSYGTSATIEGKEKRQAVAADAETKTIGMHFHAEWMLVAGTIAALEALANTFEVVSVQSSGGIVYGDFVIESLDAQPTFVLDDGTLVSAVVTVSLAEPGTEPALYLAAAHKPLATSDNATDVVSAPKSDNPTSSPGAVSPQDIARM